MDSYTEAELEVAQILLMLPKLLPDSDHRLPCIHYLRWGFKRKRSCEDETRFQDIRPPPRISPPPNAKKPINNNSGDDKKVAVKVEAATSSPATPLSFSPSGDDTDTKTKHKPSPPPTKPKKPKQRHKEFIKEKSQVLAQLSEVNKILKQEVAESRQKHNALTVGNSRLVKQLEISQKWEIEQKKLLYRNPLHPSLPMSCINTATTFSVNPHPPPPPPMDHRTVSEAEEANTHSQYQQHTWVSPQFWSLNSSHYGNARLCNVPDLNASAEEGFRLGLEQQQQSPNDAKRAAMAEARKKRIELRKKSYVAAAATKTPRFR